MLKIDTLKNEKGIALIVALIMALLVSLIGITAIKMSGTGFITFGSEKRYQLAKEAAEYALNSAVDYVLTNAGCPSSTATSGTVGGTNAGYSYFAVASDSGANFCFLNGTGTYRGATVTVTAVVPKYVTDYGALTFRNGGTLVIGGSSTVVSCASDCKTPGVAYGTSLNMCGNKACTKLPDISVSDGVSCATKGISGAPSAVQDMEGNECTTYNCAGAAMSDRIPFVFNSDNWTDLQADLGNLPMNKHKINVANLDTAATGSLISDWDTTTAGNQDMPSTSTAPSPACVCNLAADYTLTTSETSCNSGATVFSTCGTSIKFTGANVTISGIPTSSTFSTIVSTGNITMSGATSDKTHTGLSIYTTSGANITVNDTRVTLQGATLVSGGALTVTNAKNITSSDGTVNGSGSSLIAEGGNIALTSINGIAYSTMVTTNTGATVALNDSDITGSTIVTRGNFNFNTDTKDVADTYILANSMTFTKFNTNASIQGGLLYSSGVMDFTATISKLFIGTQANPVMMMAGGNIETDHMTGDATIYGLVFTNGLFLNNDSSTGQFLIEGAVVSNGTSGSSDFGSVGQANITFSKTVLDNLSGAGKTFSGFMKTPPCGKGGRRSYLASNKTTMY